DRRLHHRRRAGRVSHGEAVGPRPVSAAGTDRPPDPDPGGPPAHVRASPRKARAAPGRVRAARAKPPGAGPAVPALVLAGEAAIGDGSRPPPGAGRRRRERGRVRRPPLRAGTPRPRGAALVSAVY